MYVGHPRVTKPPTLLLAQNSLLELSGDAMHYVMIEEKLVESLRMEWEDAKRTK